MKLSEVLSALGSGNFRGIARETSDPGDTEVNGVYYRSDMVKPGGLFVALSGHRNDGHAFVEDAFSRGAAAVVTQMPVNTSGCVILVNNTRTALGRMSAAFYGYPSEKVTLIGVTGTNGKTTTAFLLEQILNKAGLSAGVIGTINYHYAGRTLKSGLTTPEAPDLHRLLAEMSGAGVSHVILEVSSHGVALERIAGCRFAAGVFTNLSQDHLDFHKDMDDYWSAKKRFFTDYIRQADGLAVINVDDKKGRELAGTLEGVDRIRVGLADDARIRASELKFDQTGTSGRLHFNEDSFQFHSRLAGRFNLENILCASGAAFAMGVGPEIIREGIEAFVSVPGRLERIPNKLDRHVFVDFSHTPAALENVLLTLREIVDGRVICIFGCGGDRDRAKRPMMGGVAARYADFVVVTSDNPRTEEPEKIIEDILKGITGHRRVPADSFSTGSEWGIFTVEADRRKAIRLGIRASKPGDAVLIAGKGHETYQIIGEDIVAFDDRFEAEKVLSRDMADVADTVDY